MSVLNENTIIGASAAGEYEIEQSLRFNALDTSYLSWTPSSTGNNKTWTYSVWIKQSDIATTTGASTRIFEAYSDNSNRIGMYFDGDACNPLSLYGTHGGVNFRLLTNACYRDFSGWMHIVLNVDTTQSTASNRIKLFVNGEQITSFSTSTYPALNATTVINTGSKIHTIGVGNYDSARLAGSYFNGYMGEVNFIDGLALTPDSFGETGTYGEWKPKAYAGTYGTNGFYLPFEQDYSVEGFSTVTYEGTGAAQYIGGTGFSPSLVWMKNRSASQSHALVDVVRGRSKILFSDGTGAEQTSATVNDDLVSFDTDGFTVGPPERAGSTNNNGSDIVAWNWDMGGTTASNTSGTITSSVRANTTYGQSIVSYTGNGTGGSTLGHGLASAPTLIIVKKRSQADEWKIYSETLGNTKALAFDTATPIETAAYWNNTSPTSSVFSVGHGGHTNASSQTHIAYCFHDVANYSKFGSYSGNGSNTGTVVTTGFNPAFVMIKRSSSTGGWIMIDNTRSAGPNPINHKLQADDVGAEDVDTSWNISFLSNGFQLGSNHVWMNASGSTYIYMAFADTREYAYWYDQSGNNNDWTSQGGLTESDVMVDSPTNNFCTFNPIDKRGSGATLSEGNLKFKNNSGTSTRGTIASQADGKIYFEVYNPTVVSNTNVHHMGLASMDVNINNATSTETGLGGGAVVYTYANASGGTVSAAQNGSAVGSAVTIPNAIAAGDIIAFASDSSTGKVWMSINNSWLKNNGQFDGSNALSSSNYLFQLNAGYEFTPYTMPVGNYVGVLNCGQDSSFAGNTTPQGNQDSNDVGDFFYAPPTGFLSLCTKNLASVDVIPSENFNTVLYTGNSSTQSVTTGLSPDFVWVKSRSTASYYPTLFDSVRGPLKRIFSNTTGAEDTTANTLTAFNSDGFTLGSQGGQNASGETYVAWNWLAGTTVSNTNGSVTTSVSANQSAGFSVVNVPTTGSVLTAGHGLLQAPEMILEKSRDRADNWIVYHSALGNTKAIYLNLTNAAATATGFWNDTSPTSTVWTMGTENSVNNASQETIAYCFHSVDGYSKIGSYKGTTVNAGSFVHTGFKVAFVLIKTMFDGDPWVMMDAARDPYNAATKRLRPDSSAAETTDAQLTCDFLSNGFKPYGNSYHINGNSQTYLYMAFAENPFKHTNAR